MELFFVAYSLYTDVTQSGMRATTYVPFVLLGVALFIALGFEFVNGFHDTANAVATEAGTVAGPVAGTVAAGNPRAIVSGYLRTRQFEPAVMRALARLSLDIKTQVEQYGSPRLLPAAAVQNVRNDMYLATETWPREDPGCGPPPCATC